MRRLLVYDTLEGVVFLIGREKIASLVQLPSNLSCRKHLFLVCTLHIWLFPVNSSYFIRKSIAENLKTCHLLWTISLYNESIQKYDSCSLRQMQQIFQTFIAFRQL